MNDESIKFWDKAITKIYWLGVAFVSVLALNTVVNVYQNTKKEENDDEDEDNSPQTKNQKNKKVKFIGGLDTKEVQKGDQAIGVLDDSKFKTPITTEVERRRKGSFDVKSLKTLESSTRDVSTYTIAFTGGPCAGKLDFIR